MKVLPTRRGFMVTLLIILTLTPGTHACWFPGFCNIANWFRNTVAPALSNAWHAVTHFVVHTADTVDHAVVHAAEDVEHHVVHAAKAADHWVVREADQVGRWVKKEAPVVGDWLLKETYKAAVWAVQEVEAGWDYLKSTVSGLVMGIWMLAKFAWMELDGMFTPAEVDEPIDDRTPPPLYDPAYPMYKNCTPGYHGTLNNATVEMYTKDLSILMNKMSSTSGEAYWNWLRCPGRVNITTGMMYNWFQLLTPDTQLFLLGFSFNTTESFPAEANGDMVKPHSSFKSCDGIFYNFDDAVSCDFNNLVTWMMSITWADIWKAGEFIGTMVLDYFTLGVFSGVVDGVQDIVHHNWWGLVKDIATTVLFLVICL